MICAHLDKQVVILPLGAQPSAEADEVGAKGSDVCLVLSGDPFRRHKEDLDGDEVPEFYSEIVCPIHVMVCVLWCGTCVYCVTLGFR